MLVQLVDAGVDRPELDHLGADVDDEARIGGAAGGGQLGRCGRCGAWPPASTSFARRAALAEERLGAEHPGRASSRAPCFFRMASTRCFSDASVLSVEKRKLKSTSTEPGNHVARAGAGVDVGDLEAGRREALVALVPLRRRQLGERRGERGGSGSSPGAGRRRGPARRARSACRKASRGGRSSACRRARRPRWARRRCSSRWLSPRCFSASTTRTVPSTAGPSSSEVRSRAIDPEWSGFSFDESFRGHDEGGDRGLHVGGAAAVELAVADGRHEGIGVPLGERAGRHDVGVAGEADERLARAAARPQVGDLAEVHRLALEAGRGEALRRRAPGSRRLRA